MPWGARREVGLVSGLSLGWAPSAAVSDSGQEPGLCGKQLMHPVTARQNPAALFLQVRHTVLTQKISITTARAIS